MEHCVQPNQSTSRTSFTDFCHLPIGLRRDTEAQISHNLILKSRNRFFRLVFSPYSSDWSRFVIFFFFLYAYKISRILHAAIVMSRGRSGGSRLHRNAVRSESVLQRSRRQLVDVVNVLHAVVAAGHADAVAGVRPRDRQVRVPRHGRRRLRRVVRETADTSRSGSVEVRERHVRRPDLRRIRCRQRYERYVINNIINDTRCVPQPVRR